VLDFLASWKIGGTCVLGVCGEECADSQPFWMLARRWPIRICMSMLSLIEEGIEEHW